jgi:hypothetical protein
MSEEPTRWLHIYRQEAHHDEVFMVCNREAISTLLTLRENKEETLLGLEMPYSEDWARGNSGISIEEYFRYRHAMRSKVKRGYSIDGTR